MPNNKIKQIRLQGETYDIALDNIDKVDGLTEKLNTFTNISVLPNDINETKTKFRITAKDYTGNTTTTTRYYKLLTLPINDTNNYASALIEGRIGGWASNSITDINAVIWNRGTPGISIFSLASGATTTATSIWDVCDLVLYVNSSSTSAAATATLYAKCYSSFIFDLDIELFQSNASIVFDGTYVTAPSGTLAAQASTSKSKFEILNGKITVGTDTLLVGNWNSSTGVLTLNTFSN